MIPSSSLISEVILCFERIRPLLLTCGSHRNGAHMLTRKMSICLMHMRISSLTSMHFILAEVVSYITIMYNA